MENLESHEPIIRYNTLLQILSGKELIILKQQDITAILSLMEDSQKKIRFAASNVLCKYSRHLGLLEDSVLFVIMKNIIKAFNGIQNSDDFSKFSTNLVFETRIQALHCLKGFIILIYENDRTAKYLNFLFTTILDSSCSNLLKLAVIKVINGVLKTPRNIKRVFGLFRHRILSLKGQEVLDMEIERFSSIWEYLGCLKVPKISDSDDLSLSKIFSRKSMSTTFSRRKLKVEKSKSTIKSEISLFGFPLSIDSQGLDITQELELQDLPMEDLEKGILKFGSEKALVFSKIPFQETVYLRNMATDRILKFSVQVFPSEFFTLSPAVGALKGGESVALKVLFTPNPFHSHILQMIRGFIRVRSMGCALERYF